MVWDAETNAVLGSLSEDLGEVHSVAFSPDGLRHRRRTGRRDGVGYGTRRAGAASSARLRTRHEGAGLLLRRVLARRPPHRQRVGRWVSACLGRAESVTPCSLPCGGTSREVDLVQGSCPTGPAHREQVVQRRDSAGLGREERNMPGQDRGAGRPAGVRGQG